MRKPLSLIEQVKAARAEVDNWPESVKSATDFRYSDFFRNNQMTAHASKKHDHKQRLLRSEAVEA